MAGFWTRKWSLGSTPVRRCCEGNERPGGGGPGPPPDLPVINR